MVHHFDYPDHHAFGISDVRKICEVAKKENASIVTTEKDAVRLMAPDLLAGLEGVNSFFIPIKTKFLQNGADFDSWLSTKLEAFPK